METMPQYLSENPRSQGSEYQQSVHKTLTDRVYTIWNTSTITNEL